MCRTLKKRVVFSAIYYAGYAKLHFSKQPVFQVGDALWRYAFQFSVLFFPVKFHMICFFKPNIGGKFGLSNETTMKKINDSDFPAHFWAKCFKSDYCWEWQASKTALGYGQVFFRGRMTSAHRTAYILSNGEIDGGLHVLHSCDNRGCVNPGHLHLGTHAENMHEMVQRGRSGNHASRRARQPARIYPFSCLHPDVAQNRKPGKLPCRVCGLLAGSTKRPSYIGRSREELESMYMRYVGI